MISIGRVGAGDAAAYYLERQAGCELDYYTGTGESRGVWLGDGASTLGLIGRLDEAGEQALRGLLSGCGVDGDRLVGPVLRADPRSRLAAAPLIRAIEAQGPLSDEPTINQKVSAVLRAAADRVASGRDVTLPAEVVARVSTAYGLDPVALYRQPDGTEPFSEALRHAEDRVDVRRPGLDVTVSAPKSVSFLYGLGDPAVAQAARSAHEIAVGEVIAYLQRHAATAVRGHHGGGKRAARIGTDGLIVAAFDHRTSRAGDPQLHTHLVIPNLVHGADGQWSAMDTAAVYRHARTASSLYHAVLRGELTRTLGVGWTPVRRGVADIDGISRVTIDAFSKRRAQITAAMTDRGTHGAKAAQAACLDTRPAKRHETTSTLRERWHTEAVGLGMDPAAARHVIGRTSTPAPPDVAALAKILLGPDGVTAEHTTFTRQELARAVCETLPAGTAVRLADIDQLVTDLVTHSEVVPVIAGDALERRYTTRDLLATERAALKLATTAPPQPVGRAAHLEHLAAGLRSTELSEEQTHMVITLTGSGRRVDVVAGPAGAGKTAGLAAAHQIWAAAGHPVRGTTVSWLAAGQLESATGIPTVSLAKTLLDADRCGLPTGVVMVLDEASMVNTRAIARLLNHVSAADGKLILVGDPYQLPEIGAGGMFAALASRPEAITLSGNQRQQQPWERDALHQLRDGDPANALEAYRAHDRLHTADDASALVSDVAIDYQAARDRGEDVLVLAARRSDVAQLNQAIRGRLIDTGALGPAALTVCTDIGELDYRVGDHVLVTVNDRRRGLTNGARGTVTTVDAATGHLAVELADQRAVTFDPQWLATGALVHGYATTVHKAQGVTVDTTLVYGLGPLTREHGYVALSRGRSSNHLYLTNNTPPTDDCGPPRARRERPTRSHTAEVLERLRISAQQQLALSQVAERDPFGNDLDPFSPARGDDRDRGYGRGR